MLQLRWQGGHPGLINIFQSLDLEHWTLLTNLEATSGAITVMPENGNRFYKATILNNGITNQLPLDMGKLTPPDTTTKPTNANSAN
jgi:hypothetical protein